MLIDIRPEASKMEQYIYVMDNECFYPFKCKKYGFTTEPHERLKDTQVPTPNMYEHLWKIDHVPEHCTTISRDDNIITNILNTPNHGYNMVKYDGGGGKEFFQGDSMEVYRMLIDLGYILTKVPLEDVEKMNRDALSIVSPSKPSIKELLGLEDVENAIQPSKPKWNTRDYQTEAITYALQVLLTFQRIYLELATGGGKSYIVFNILKLLGVETIVIFSPRKIVNEQNIKSKYLNILGNTCNVYNVSDNNTESFYDFNKKPGIKVIVSCTQSYKKVHKLIVDNDMNNVAIWFDEAHWGLEDWLTADPQDIKRLLLEDISRISYRVFTSASPDREVVKRNPAIFGELYTPIKVSKLIQEGWLCPISPYVYCEDKNEADVLYYMLHHFIEHRKTWGFSFHHNQANASSMFIEHLKRYKDGITKIKPFILISDNTFLKDIMTENEISEYTSLNNFEGTTNSIAYVVAKYSMGYDFNKIDLICFSDYKISSKDIIQSIGRGTRPDALGLDGRNKNKQLNVLLPVFPDSEDIDKYYRIAEVLAYLVGEVEISLDKIVFTYSNEIKEVEHNENALTDYTGIETVRSKVFEATKFILNRTKKITYKYIKELNKKLRLKSRNDYLQSAPRHQYFIKDPETTFKQEWVSWYDFIGLDTSTYLQTKEEFITYCTINSISTCDEYNIHYLTNKNNKLPQDPFQMYPTFTNWDDELNEQEELVW